MGEDRRRAQESQWKLRAAAGRSGGDRGSGPERAEQGNPGARRLARVRGRERYPVWILLSGLGKGRRGVRRLLLLAETRAGAKSGPVAVGIAGAGAPSGKGGQRLQTAEIDQAALGIHSAQRRA